MPSSVDLGSKLERSIKQLIARGRYRSRSEILREGVRLVEEREARLRALDERIGEGLRQADAGQIIPVGRAFRQLAAHYRRPRSKIGN